MCEGSRDYIYDGQIEIPPEDVSEYCIDSSVLRFQPSDSDVHDKITKTRCIFNNCPISVLENDLIRQFTSYLHTIPSEYNWNDMGNEFLRFLYTANFNFEDAGRLIAENYKYRFHSKLLPATLSSVQSVLNSGCLYWHGRDKNARPTLVINPQRLSDLTSDVIDALLAFTLEFFLRYLCVAGRAENYVIIVDCEHEGLLSMSFQMANLFRDMGSKYRGRLYRIFFINTPKFFSVVLSSLTSLLPSSTCNKIVVLGDDYKETFSANYNPWQLERKFGGEVDLKSWYPFKFYPNCTSATVNNSNSTEVYGDNVAIGSKIHDLPKIFFTGRCLVPCQKDIWQPYLNTLALTETTVKYLTNIDPSLQDCLNLVGDYEDLRRLYFDN